MLFFSILFLIIGSGFIVYGITLVDSYVTQQGIKYIVFLLGFICLSTGTILLALRSILNSIHELLDFFKSKKNNETDFNNKNEAEVATKICPFCAGKIKKEATVCSFCGRYLDKTKSEIIETTSNKSNEGEKKEVLDINNAAPHCEQKGICTPLKPQDDDWFCFYCGIRNRYGSLKCRCCGNSKKSDTSED
ncbi:MAG: hypothetical protein K5829_10525 [Treponema sp.]|nr:hypothetical protein [Treponema sp.]